MAEPEPPPVGVLPSAAQLRKKANRGSTMATLTLGLPNFAAADEPTPVLGRHLARAWAFRKLHHAGAAAFTGEDDGYLAEEQLEEQLAELDEEEEQFDGGGLDPVAVADAPVALWGGDPGSANELLLQEQHHQHHRQHQLDLAGDASSGGGERHARQVHKGTVEALAVRPPPFPPPLYGRPPSYNTSNLLHATGALPGVLAQLPSAVDLSSSSLGSRAPPLSPVERETAPISVPLSAASRDEYDEVVGSVLMRRSRQRRQRPVSLAAGFGRPRPSLAADSGFAENGSSSLPGTRPGVSRYCCSFSAPTSPVKSPSPDDDVDDEPLPPSPDAVAPDEPDEPDEEDDDGPDDPKEYYWQYLSLKREYEFLVSQFSSLRAQTLAVPSSAPLPDPPADRSVRTVVDAAVQTDEVDQCTICRSCMSAAAATSTVATALFTAPRKRKRSSLPPPSPDGCERQQSREEDVERHWDEENLKGGARDEEADLEVGQGTAWSWFLWLASGIAIIGRELIRVSLHCWEMADDDLRAIAL